MDTPHKISRMPMQYVGRFFACRFRHRRVIGRSITRPGTMALLVLIALLSVGLGLSALFADAVSARTLIPTDKIPFRSADAAAFVDLWSDGHLDLVLAGSSGVAAFAREGEGWRETLRLPPLPAPVTAVAVGDVTGDGVNELILGTGQAGAIYVLRRSGSGWTLLAQTPYMWSPIRSVLVTDLSGDGKAEIVALSGDGRLAAYRWDELGLSGVEPPSLAADRITHMGFIPAPVGEGGARLVLAESGGRIAVWSWPWTRPDWETFVWGLPSSLAVFPGGDSAPGSIVVTTYERLLYHFRGDREQFVSAGPPLTDPRLPFSFTVPVHLPGDGNVHVLAANGEGLGLWRIVATNMTSVDQGWADNVRWALQLPGDDRFLLGEADRAPTVWTRMPVDFFEFTVDGTRVTLQDPPLFRQGQVMLSSRDWAAALGMQVHWDPVEQRITLFRNFDYAMVTMGEWEVILPTGRRPLSMAPVNEGGRTYVPPELPVWFGFDYRWDGRTRTLEVRSRRGQGTDL